MHDEHPYKNGYNFDQLIASYPDLVNLIITTPDGRKSISFHDPMAVHALNAALLSHTYGIGNYKLASGYLSPPVPSRLDYVLHIRDIVGSGRKKGLDIGTGANVIYPILGAAHCNWTMVGSEVDEDSFALAKAVLQQLHWSGQDHSDLIEIRRQHDRGSILKNIIAADEHFDFVMCNPPFYSSEKEATKAHLKKNKNLNTVPTTSNFNGQPHELWCNGGEALFIKRLIKESVLFKDQVKWFTCLVAHKNHLAQIEKQLLRLKSDYQVVPMNSGHKKSRFISWRF